jgi:hypothetical protein
MLESLLIVAPFVLIYFTLRPLERRIDAQLNRINEAVALMNSLAERSRQMEDRSLQQAEQIAAQLTRIEWALDPYLDPDRRPRQ